ncbi:hypothetical protein [Methylobacterium organophilum]|uniref:Lipoprotein n=1 Tax=Methylobacterium organophilum TaxID=410 RepID=A0ABQ4T4T3_METOR|nr:hypothetical protein [Methylobacterium organophilum]GJE26258.1 hypothetical protein LKMONMHP_1107 [Methylobacterium organophilum]
MTMRCAHALGLAAGALLAVSLCFGALSAWLYLGALISTACGVGAGPGFAVVWLVMAIGLARLLSAKFARAGLL